MLVQVTGHDVALVDAGLEALPQDEISMALPRWPHLMSVALTATA